MPTLFVGNPAPPLKVAKWLKGKPITAYEPGKVYVVEFWATWCGPCIGNIPHLTALAKKYAGKVAITGVSVWEDNHPMPEAAIDKNAYMNRVMKFVKDWDGRMEYNVAADGSDFTMSTTWLVAAGQLGIPATFVIRDGTIQWIGHPTEVDEPLAKILDGTWDLKAEAARQTKQSKASVARFLQMQPIYAAIGAGDNKKVVEEVDKLTAAHPNTELSTCTYKFRSLLVLDQSAAYAYAKQVAAGVAKNKPAQLNTIAFRIANQKPELHPDYALAVALAQQAVDLVKPDDPDMASLLDTLAFAQDKAGDLDRAIAAEEKAAALAAKIDKFDPEMKQQITARLSALKQKKGGGGRILAALRRAPQIKQASRQSG